MDYNAFGNWGLAAIVIVAISWGFYRFIAPKGWKEWAGAGLVQAFIIALYAEMYGFPLTIYLLARAFGIDARSGNLWSNLFGAGEAAMMVAMLIGYSLVIAGLILVVEGWQEIYHARRSGRLATEGIYSVVRHPQYSGILLGLFGEGVVHWPTIFSVGLFPFIILAYVLLARREEREMIARHGDLYRDYQRRVPMFLPRRGRWTAIVTERRRRRHGRPKEETLTKR